MKLLLKAPPSSFLNYLSIFLLLALISISISSCSDEIINSEVHVDEYYSYTSQPFPFDTVYGMQAVDDNTIFLFSHGVYKFSDGVSSEINYNDNNFGWWDFKAFSPEHYVFTGRKTTAPYSPMIKVYDNGIYTDYTLPFDSLDYSPYIVSFIEKNKFIIGSFPSRKYYVFDNGTITNFTLPNTNSPDAFAGKINGSTYFISYEGVQQHNVYKFTGSGAQLLFSYGNAGEYDMLYALEKDIIKIVRTGRIAQFSYLTETGWSNIYNYDMKSDTAFVRGVIGKSHSQFLFLVQEGQESYSAYAYDGLNFTKQINFPLIRRQYAEGELSYSNFTRRSFYMYNNFNTRQLIKATFRE